MCVLEDLKTSSRVGSETREEKCEAVSSTHVYGVCVCGGGVSELDSA